MAEERDERGVLGVLSMTTGGCAWRWCVGIGRE